MRNLSQYPVENWEVIEFLERKYDEEISSGRIGSIDPVIISYLKEYLTEHDVEFDAWLILKNI